MRKFIRPGFVVVIVGFTLTSLSTLVVMLRYYCRWFRMGTIGATDHLMFIALLLTWGNTVINYYQDLSSSKFRPNFFKIPEKRPLLEAHLRGVLVTWYIYRMSYGVALMFVKLSILFFYRAIASHQKFRRVVHATIWFVILYTVAVTLASAFQCDNPADSYSIEGYLAQFDGNPKTRKVHNKCFDPSKLWVFSGATNLFTDVLIMLMPIPTILGLRVPMSKRLALVGIFSVGIMAIVASCVRMWVMALWAESPQNSARFGADLLLWGQVETNAGIISASVPFLRLFFRGREREKAYVSDQRVGPQPRAPAPGALPKAQDADGKATEIDTMAFFGDDKLPGDLEGDEGGLPEEKRWKPFITVPESLSSRGSGMMEPVNATSTV